MYSLTYRLEAPRRRTTIRAGRDAESAEPGRASLKAARAVFGFRQLRKCPTITRHTFAVASTWRWAIVDRRSREAPARRWIAMLALLTRAWGGPLDRFVYS